MKKTYLFLLAVVMVALASCSPSKNSTPQELTGISLNKKSIEVELNDTYQLRVWYEPEEAEDTAPDVIWDTSKARVATVSGNGKVTGKAIGKATITATCGKFTAECEVKVVEASSNPPVTPPDSPESFSVSPKVINSPANGGTFTLEVTATLPWSAVCQQSWASVTPSSGNGDATLTVTVEPNSVEVADEQKIVFMAGEFTEYVTISREAQAVSKYVAKPFSISSTKTVVFSPGNLQYHCLNKVWRFAEHQYDFVGNGTEGNVYVGSVKQNNSFISPTYDGWIDLFGWGTGADPTFKGGKDLLNLEYKETFVDWGNNTISNADGTGWFTLDDTGWRYLISERANAEDLKSRATVCGVKGYILLPDQWELPEGLSFTPRADSYSGNQYSVAEWGKMESVGAVFLPDAMRRELTAILTDGLCYYNTSIDNGYYCCCYMVFFSASSDIKVSSYSRNDGCPVRLVKSKE